MIRGENTKNPPFHFIGLEPDSVCKSQSLWMCCRPLCWQIEPRELENSGQRVYRLKKRQNVKPFSKVFGVLVRVFVFCCGESTFTDKWHLTLDTWHMKFFFFSLFLLVSVLLSAHIEIFGVFCIIDLSVLFSHFAFHCLTSKWFD